MPGNERIQNIIQEKERLIIDLFDGEGNSVGCLTPITQSVLADRPTIEKLAVWRNQARKYFQTQFTATYERTKDWLENSVLKDPGRLLFLVRSKNMPIGHLGFKGLSPASAELDNLLRGEKGGHPRLIYFAECALIDWLFANFSIDEVCGYVLADNFLTLQLHQSVGFRLTVRAPLLSKVQGEEIHLEMASGGKPSPLGFYSQKIELTRLEYMLRKEE